MKVLKHHCLLFDALMSCRSINWMLTHLGHNNQVLLIAAIIADEGRGQQPLPTITCINSRQCAREYDEWQVLKITLRAETFKVEQLQLQLHLRCWEKFIILLLAWPQSQSQGKKRTRTRAQKLSCLFITSCSHTGTHTDPRISSLLALKYYRKKP